MTATGPDQTARTRLIVALDVPSRQRADELAQSLGGTVSWFKIGLELFSAEGPDLVRDYKSLGHNVFLDLKLHDIPATVGRAVERLGGLGADLLTVHAAGGVAMMKAAVQAARSHNLGILAVTVLTSLDVSDLQAIGVQGAVQDIVIRRALLAVEAGCRGVVASPHEAAAIRAVVPQDFLIVTPGVRGPGHDAGDQKRTMTPGQARDAGADMVVVGRPIRDAPDPSAAARSIVEELNE